MDILDNVLGFALDEEQRKVVWDKHRYTLVVASAGSGKTLTIVGKILYLIQVEKMAKEEILCISFTNKTVDSLKTKLKSYYNIELDIMTFHKLALSILKTSHKNYSIAPANTLEYTLEEYFKGIILENEDLMKIVLRYFQIPIRKNITHTYQRWIRLEEKKIDDFIRLIATFIRLLKGKGKGLEEIFTLLWKSRRKIFPLFKERQTLFLILVLNGYQFYEEELKSSGLIDFDDMITYAKNSVENNEKIKKYRYIIIDEYQDTSYHRHLLIEQILNVSGASLLAVGDDFQSIYQFSGCDLTLFLNFSQYFSPANIIYLTKTYRNSQELANIAGKFIMKNKKQIKKQVNSNHHLKVPIEIYYTKDQKLTLKKRLDNINTREVLILGRNHFDIFPLLDEELIMKEDILFYRKRPDLKINYLTIHKSKGLEAESVIIIHVDDDVVGLPSKVKDAKYLNLIQNRKEIIPYAEERRIFYVALTRTKNKVYLIANRKKASSFLRELTSENTRIYIE